MILEIISNLTNYLGYYNIIGSNQLEYTECMADL